MRTQENHIWLAIGDRSKDNPETPCAVSQAFEVKENAEEKAQDMRESEREEFGRVIVTKRRIMDN